MYISIISNISNVYENVDDKSKNDVYETFAR